MNPRYERWRWRTFGITWLIYASYYLTRNAWSAAKTALPDDPHVKLQRSEYGIVDSTQLAAYMLGQFIFGPLGDRFGPRRLLIGGMLLSVAAAAGMGFSTALTAFVAFAAFQGIAQSTGWSNTTKTMGAWFSLRERGRVIGWWCSHYAVGAAVAAPFAGWMMGAFGRSRSVGEPGTPMVSFWPAAFWASAAVVAVVAGLTWLLLRNRPEDVGLPPIEDYHGEPKSLLEGEVPAEEVQEGAWQIIGQVLATPSIWILGAAYFSIKFARYALNNWGPMYVAESSGSDPFVSNLTTAAMPIGGVVGLIVSGFLSDKLFQSRRAPVAVLSLAATAVVMLVGLTPIHNNWAMGGFFFLIGFFLYGPDTMISATAAMDFGTKRGAGTATGFVNGIGSVGGMLAGYLPGVLTTKDNWTGLFAIMVFGLLLSAAILLPLWRRKPPTA